MKRQPKRGQNRRGFSLIEIMVSVSIASLVVVISLPIFTRMKIAANEGGARKALTAYRNAVNNFQIESGAGAFPTSLTDLAGLVDTTLAPTQAGTQATRSGYAFTFEGANQTTDQIFRIYARPEVPGTSGINTFFLDQSGTIFTIDEGLLGGTFNAFGVDMFPIVHLDSAGFLDALISGVLTHDEQVDILAGLIADLAYQSEGYYLDHIDQYGLPYKDEIRAFQLTVADLQKDGLGELFLEAKQLVSDQLGIELYGQVIEDIGVEVIPEANFVGYGTSLPFGALGPSVTTQGVAIESVLFPQYAEPTALPGFASLQIGFQLPDSATPVSQTKNTGNGDYEGNVFTDGDGSPLIDAYEAFRAQVQ
jgi:prepilin-type N-terminal cleavage/methylation domain-containing protein